MRGNIWFGWSGGDKRITDTADCTVSLRQHHHFASFSVHHLPLSLSLSSCRPGHAGVGDPVWRLSGFSISRGGELGIFGRGGLGPQ